MRAAWIRVHLRTLQAKVVLCSFVSLPWSDWIPVCSSLVGLQVLCMVVITNTHSSAAPCFFFSFGGNLSSPAALYIQESPIVCVHVCPCHTLLQLFKETDNFLCVCSSLLLFAVLLKGLILGVCLCVCSLMTFTKTGYFPNTCDQWCCCRVTRLSVVIQALEWFCCVSCVPFIVRPPVQLCCNSWIKIVSSALRLS